MELQISTGIKEYRINGAVTVRFNPTDAAFAERVVDTFTALEGKQEGYKRELSGANSTKAVFDVARKWDADMREIIDGVFNAPVCQALFGDMNVYAIGDGVPVWMNLMLWAMDEISVGLEGVGDEIPAKIKAYTDKYKGKTK